MTAMRGDVGLKAAGRALGCLLGGAFGLLAMPLVAGAVLPWLACIFLGLFACAHLRHGSGDASYAGQQAGVALLMAMVQGSAPTADLLPAIDRLIGIGGGIVVVARSS